MAGGIHDVDLDAVVVDRGDFGEDRNPLLALQVVGVHHSLDHDLIAAERAALAEDDVNQRRLAMIDVSDDGDVPHVGPYAGRRLRDCLSLLGLAHIILTKAAKAA